MQTELPIAEVLAQLGNCLSKHNECVLEAPPGAGKTTIVPLALRQANWLGEQKIIMLEPRRMAARAAAERMASLLGEKAGETVGYRVRLETRVSAQTRIEVITEGILTRMLQSDPSLAGVGLLIFDEFHERSLDSDLGLALTLQARELFREADQPLKLLLMSATLDGAAAADLLDGAPVVSSQGKQFPVQVHYGDPWQPKQNIVARTVATLCSVMSRPETGSVLVFLPGQGEIRRVLQDLPAMEAVIVAPLYGGLSLAEQRQAIESAPAGKRKIVLATNIAETSLTIEGITTVVDSGLAREPAYDPATGMTRLQTCRISQDSAIQRLGRAGRLASGHCYRLWSEEQQKQLAPRSTPEILQADLTSLVLQLLAWGIDQPGELRWLDLPPAGPWDQALELLSEFGAVAATESGGWRITREGEQLAKLPVHPRLGHMLLCGARWGQLQQACELAASLTERGERQQQQVKQFLRVCDSLPTGESRQLQDGVLLTCAYPDRIARRRQPRGNIYQLSSGRSAALDASDPLCNNEWLVAAEVGGRVGQVEDRIWHAVALNPDAFDAELEHLVETRRRLHWDDAAGRFVAEAQRRVGAIILSRSRIEDLPAQAYSEAVLELLREKGLGLLPWTEELQQWRARVKLLHENLGEPWPDLSDAALLANLQWLEPYIYNVRKLSDFRSLDLPSILAGLLAWPLPRELDQLAPEHIEVPSGSSVRIDYQHTPPVLAVKLQEMFGCETTPAIVGGRVNLMLHLLSPARRPLQVTQDLASFWRGGYDAVKKEMRGRYPKHPWPEDPLQALPTGKTNRRLRKD